jgi:uncharacterized protein YbaA (DUF1428 family)
MMRATRVNANVMKDPRIKMDASPMPCGVRRRACGGFEVLVDLGQVASPE